MKTAKPKQKKQDAISAIHKSQPISQDQIRQRAHQIYLARGGAAGMHLNDWLQAEQELKRELQREQSKNGSSPTSRE